MIKCNSEATFSLLFSRLSTLKKQNPDHLLRGSQKVLSRVLHAVEEASLDKFFEVQATFCSEQCDRGPTVRIGDEEIYRAEPEAVVAKLRKLAGSGVLTS